MLRLGAGEQGVMEILGVAEHVVSVSAAAEGLRIRPDVPDAPVGPPTELLPPVDEQSAGEGTLARIREWSETSLGLDRAPAFWLVFARRPRFLDALWAKHRLVLGAAHLDASTKVCVALAVAMNQRSPYWTSYFAQLGRRMGVLDDAIIAELAACVIHITSYNTIAHGMRLEAPYSDLDSRELPPEPGATG